MIQTGLTLHRKKSIVVPSEFCLLIVSRSDDYQEQVCQVVRGLSIKSDCTVTLPQNAEQALLERQYDLILYHYHPEETSSRKFDDKYPLPELAWWYETQKQVPLILISQPLGEQAALATIRSGVVDCIPEVQLNLLPQAIDRVMATYLRETAPDLQQLIQEITLLREQVVALQQENTNLREQETNDNGSQEYLSHLSHELRSPLANILQFAKILQAQHFGSLNNKQAEYIKGVITCSNHLFELINDYLDIAKIDANHEELFLEQIVVEDICNAAMVMLQGKAKEKELQFSLTIGESVDFCHADQLRLKQVLINLLSNAIKFTEEGSVTLKVEVKAEWLVFSVVDTGIGICEADSHKLFQPFQQLKTPMNRKHKGTGLGLALSRKLAQLHGGDITLTSEVGKGSCFALTLPLHT